jgi:hypothetical protein
MQNNPGYEQKQARMHVFVNSGTIISISWQSVIIRHVFSPYKDLHALIQNTDRVTFFVCQRSKASHGNLVPSFTR